MTSERFDSTDIAGMDPAELVRRFEEIRSRSPYRAGGASGRGVRDSMRDAVTIAKNCTRFNTELLLLLAQQYGAFFEVVANPHVTPEQPDFLLGRTARRGGIMAARLRFGLAMAARRNAFKLSEATLQRLYDATDDASPSYNADTSDLGVFRRMLDAVMDVTRPRRSDGDYCLAAP